MSHPSPPALSPPDDAASPRRVWLLGLLLALAGVVAYANSFRGAFVFDDHDHIINDLSIRQVLPPTRRVLTDRRAVFKLSLAVNYALGGLSVAGYHAVNLAVHVAAGLMLFGLTRRLLRAPATPPDLRGAATGLAFAVALLWLLHPLQTQAVTYIVQRSESLMGLFYLLMLYLLVRGAERQDSVGRRAGRGFFAAAVAACALGVLSKEVMVTAPVVALLMDRGFLAGSFGGALRRRWPVYAALAATWVVLLGLVLRDTLDPTITLHTAGFKIPNSTPAHYALSQPGVILRYLRLAVWPSGLTIDYLWPVARSWQAVAAPLAVVAALLISSLAALWRWPRLGFLACSFFLVLAPTSSVMPIADLAMEHRMYLPLAPLIALVVLAAWRGLAYFVQQGRLSEPSARGIGLALLVLAGAGLGLATIDRNRDYASEERLWRDNIAKRPQNPRAYRNLAYALSSQEKLAEASEYLAQALRMHPRDPEGHRALGMMLRDLGRVDEGLAELRVALEQEPGNPRNHAELGRTWLARGDLDLAAAAFNDALVLAPDHAESLVGLGRVYERRGEARQAWDVYVRAAELDRAWAEPLIHLGRIAFEQGESKEAAALLRQAVDLEPGNVEARRTLAEVMRSTGDWAGAAAQYAAAVPLAPRDATLRNRLGEALARAGDLSAAAQQFEAAAILDPANAEAHSNLGNLALQRGEWAQAIAEHRRAVDLAPRAAEFKRRLALALMSQPVPPAGDLARAAELAREAAHSPGGESLVFRQTWMAAAAAAERWADAADAAQSAADAAQATGQPDLAAKMTAQGEQFRARAATTRPATQAGGGRSR